MKLPPQTVLHDWLFYDSRTGEFRWRMEPRPARPLVGQVAGYQRKTGYVFVKRRGYPHVGAHRLAWIFAFGGIPDGMEIDHRDGDPSNNAISNLRLATSSEQKRNKRVQSNNRSGLKGAFYHAAHKGKKWRSQIKVAGELIFLGYFHTPEEAHKAYAQAAETHFGEFARAA